MKPIDMIAWFTKDGVAIPIPIPIPIPIKYRFDDTVIRLIR